MDKIVSNQSIDGLARALFIVEREKNPSTWWAKVFDDLDEKGKESWRNYAEKLTKTSRFNPDEN